jgi:asparagine synthase (glutamine-hydrolysing)
MCGLAGVLNLRERRPIDEMLLRRMTSILRHRGPDESGTYVDPWIGLAHARLSIVGLESGVQPIANDDETLWIVFNGEIYNHVELRLDLAARGHRFATDTDTEVILHAFEEHGADCVHLFNGQFAFALWDSAERSLLLARDRLGVRPLFFVRSEDRLVFGSEIKALFLVPGIERSIDPISLLQTTTLWTTLPGRTSFSDVEELPPGHVMTVRDGRVEKHRYWSPPAPRPDEMWTGSMDEATEAVESTFVDAVRLRLRSDVEVGAYLSGGLDSSLTTAVVARRFDPGVRTFSVAFEEGSFDESTYQREVVRHLDLRHGEVRMGNADIASALDDVVWHTEAPLLRTGPVPLFELSRLVAEHGIKVVLTGEGADEVFGGYDVFKEAKVRRFWAKAPESKWRHRLLERLYPYVFGDPARSGAVVRGFYARSLADPDDPLFSHRVRWTNGGRNRTLLRDDLRETLAEYDPVGELAAGLAPGFGDRSHLSRAQTLEMNGFLSGYLLSSQGDRVAMAHSVEARFPFLDHRLIDLASRLPDHWKIRGLDEKHILKRVAGRHLPPGIARRRKQPYRAPVRQALGALGAAEPLRELLQPDAIARAGIFDPHKVSLLSRRLREGHDLGEVQSMALMLVLTTQLLDRRFVRGFPTSVEARTPDRVVRRTGVLTRAAAS